MGMVFEQRKDEGAAALALQVDMADGDHPGSALLRANHNWFPSMPRETRSFCWHKFKHWWFSSGVAHNTQTVAQASAHNAEDLFLWSKT